MVSTRRSGSLSANNSKRSSSSESKPPSPKRQKVDNGGSSEKPVSTPAENSKDLRTPEPVPDPGECGSADVQIAGAGSADVVSSGKVDATPAVPVTAPIADAACPSFSSWSVYQKQIPNIEGGPWCRFLSQSAQNPNVAVCIPNFTIGSNRSCNFALKDQTISGNLCKIKHTQRDGSAVAVLESTGSKGSVLVNGTHVKKNTNCVLNSGDEVVFGVLGNHSYIFQQLNTEVAIRGAEVSSGVGKFLPLERKSGDPSAVAGASILASLSIKQDLTRWKSPTHTSSKPHQGSDVSSHPVLHDSTEIELDGSESTPNVHTDKAADAQTNEKNSTMDCNPDAGAEAGNVKLSGVNDFLRPFFRILTRPSCKLKLSKSICKQVLEEKNGTLDMQAASTLGTSVRCAVFKEDVHVAILDGKEIDVSFDNFPYYLSESTKNVLVAACFMHLRHKEHEKFTSDLTTINPRILLSGPAGSEIYQEMLAKALAKYFGAKLLIFDSHLLLGGLSSKEAELLKDGLNVEKSFSSTKQSPTATKVAGSMDPPATETETPSSSNAPSLGFDSQPKLETDNMPSASGTAKSCLFKLGDRVKFSCSSSCGVYQTSPRGPSNGGRGKVVLLFDDNPLSKIGVRFDKPIPDGVDLGGACEGGQGFFCNVTDLRLESSAVEELDKLLIHSLFEVVFSESRSAPFILFMKDAEKSIVGNGDSYAFKSKLENLPDNVVVIGSHTQNDSRKEKSHPGGLLFTKFGSNQTALLDLAFPDSFGRLHDRGKEVPKPNRTLTKLFPNKIIIHMPQDEALLASWKQQLDRDVETLKIKGNLHHLRAVLGRCGMECEGLDTLCIKDQTLTNENAEKIIGWALSHHLMQNSEAKPDSKLVLSCDSIQYGIGILQSVQNESKSLKKSLKDVVTENEFEKRLLADVIPPSDIDVTFDDIGALEKVKDTLKELVMLPLQRPELFCKGQLTKPCKGILLFAAINGVTGSESNALSVTDPNSKRFFFKDQAHYVDPDPGHSFQAIREQIFGSNDTSTYPPPMNGFAQQAFSMDNTSHMSQNVMNGFIPDLVPVYKTLVSEFAVFDRWFASVPASTQPNRLFVHSATSGGATSNVAAKLAAGYPQQTIFDNVHEAGLDFGIYYQNIPATLFYRNLRKLKYLLKFHLYDLSFKLHAKEGKLPSYTVVEQRYMDTKVLPANDDHPSHDVYQGQMFVKEVYETLRASPQWNETLFLITYDEHGGFYDHVPTPARGVPSPDGIVGPEPFNFTFNRLGVRVPTIAISPWIQKGTVVHGPNGSPTSTSEYEHSSISATVKKLFNLPSFLTKRDAWAGTFEGIVQTRTEPRTDCPEKLPTPVKIREGGPNEDAQMSEFQQELIQLAAVLKGDNILTSFPGKIGKDMTVKQGKYYMDDAVRRFFEAGRYAKKMGVNEEHIVQMKPSLTTRSSKSPNRNP